MSQLAPDPGTTALVMSVGYWEGDHEDGSRTLWRVDPKIVLTLDIAYRDFLRFASGLHEEREIVAYAQSCGLPATAVEGFRRSGLLVGFTAQDVTTRLAGLRLYPSCTPLALVGPDPRGWGAIQRVKTLLPHLSSAESEVRPPITDLLAARPGVDVPATAANLTTQYSITHQEFSDALVQGMWGMTEAGIGYLGPVSGTPEP